MVRLQKLKKDKATQCGVPVFAQFSVGQKFLDDGSKFAQIGRTQGPQKPNAKLKLRV